MRPPAIITVAALPAWWAIRVANIADGLHDPLVLAGDRIVPADAIFRFYPALDTALPALIVVALCVVWAIARSSEP